MKKLLIAIVLGAVLVLALATTALADNGPHGGFTATTDACAGCHRAHTATGTEFLLVATNIYELCTGCHNGTGAYTDVVGGYYHAGGTEGDNGQCVFGGGFDFTRCMSTPDGHNQYNAGNLADNPVTSNHEVVTETTTGTVWGSGDINSTPTGGVLAGGAVLECTSCHTPHGKGGLDQASGFTNPIASYRILRFSPTGSNGFEAITGPSNAYFTANLYAQSGVTGGAQVDDVAVKWYTPNTDATVDPSVQAFRGRLVGGYYSAYINGINDWGGRTYVYQRPAFTVATGQNQYVCPDAAGNPNPADVTSCANGVAGSIWNNTVPMQKLGVWCSLCHDRYLSQGGRSVDSGDTTYMFRHTSTGSLPCVTCHGAHGTAAVMDTTLAQGATLSPVPALAPTTNSVLLKYDNRAICADCHGTSVGYYLDALVKRP